MAFVDEIETEITRTQFYGRRWNTP